MRVKTSQLYAGSPHVRFNEGEVVPAATPRRGVLLCNIRITMILAGVAASAVTARGDAVTVSVEGTRDPTEMNG